MPYTVGTNPFYSTLPQTPPGLSAIPYHIGGLYEQFTGNPVYPYVPVNQSTHDAIYAKGVTNPLYSRMMADVYAQMGMQLGNTVGGISLIQSVGGVAGYTPEQIKHALASGGETFGRSMLGQAIMPMADAFLANSGLSGGSMIAASQIAFNSRMNLMSPTALIDVYNTTQQRQSLAGTSAMIRMMNEMFSKRDKDGNLTLLPNLAATQGFSREQLAQVSTLMAGAGAFNANGQGFTEQYAAASTGHESVKKIKEFQLKYEDIMSSGVEAMSAMRDLLKTSDGIAERLMQITGGSAFRSGANMRSAAEALRKLNGAAQAYNLDPTAFFGAVELNRSMLQNAAGVDESMLSMGFTGGGMFGLQAQTHFAIGIEDTIRAAGVRGDPILSARIRQQGIQALSRNINTQAGLGAQLMAYAEQHGQISAEDARRYKQAFVSGDRSIIGGALNDLYSQVFGSPEIGRQMMNNRIFVNGMREAMSDDAGAFAVSTMMTGADREYMRREQITAAKGRRDYAMRTRKSLGLSTLRTDEDYEDQLQSVIASLGADTHEGRLFKETYSSAKERGDSNQQALNRAVSLFRKDATLSRHSEKINLALTRQDAQNQEDRLVTGGDRWRAEAFAAIGSLKQSGAIDADTADDLRTRFKEASNDDVVFEHANFVGELETKYGERGKAALAALTKAGTRVSSAHRSIVAGRDVESAMVIGRAAGLGAMQMADIYGNALTAYTTYQRKLKEAGSDRNAQDTAEYDYLSEMVRIGGDKLSPEFSRNLRKTLETGGEDAVQRLAATQMQLLKLGARNLGDSGYGSNMAGFWGQGHNAVNSVMEAGVVAANINKYAKAAKQSSYIDADARATNAQKIYNAISGGGVDAFMGALTEGSAMYGIVNKHVSKFKAVESAIKSAGEKDQAFTDAIVEYEGRGFTEGVDSLMELNAAVKNGKYVGNEKQLRTDLTEASKGNEGKNIPGLSIKQRKSLEAYYLAQNTAASAQQDAQRALVDELGTEEGVKAVRAHEINKQFADKANARKDWTWMSNIDTAKFDNKAMKKVVDSMTESEFKAKIGADIDKADVDPAVVRSTALAIDKDKAMRGDKEAAKRLDAVKEEALEGTQRITGELVIKSGNDAQPGMLQATMGGFGGY